MTVHIIPTMIALVLILVSGTWYAKNGLKSLAVMGLGAIAFCFFSSVREDGSPSGTPSAKDGTIPLMQEQPFLYVLYGIAMAALFEETARLVFLNGWRKRKLEDRDALAYGLGTWGLGDALSRNGKLDQFVDSLFTHPVFKY